MVQNLNIKKYWITSFFMVFCSFISFAQQCQYDYSRNGEIYFSNPTYGDKNGVFLNTNTLVTFGRNGSSLPSLTYDWKVYDSNGNLVQTGDYLYFNMNITKFETHKLTLRVTNYSGCTTYEKTITPRNENVCIVPTQERFDGQLNIEEYYPGFPVDMDIELHLNNPSGYNESNYTFSWKLYNAAGTVIATSSLARFPVKFPIIEEYKAEVEIKDLRGCTTTYTKMITPIDKCIVTDNERSGYIVTDNESYDGYVYPNETHEFYFSPYSKPADSFTYKWELLNSKGISLGISHDLVYPVTIIEGGYYTLKLLVTDPERGCSTEHISEIQCLITNSCTNSNPKSEKVKKLYEDLMVSLLSRSIQGETDEEINASAPTAEFIALKPYITNGPKDKIHNYVSQTAYGGEVTKMTAQKIKGARFSFSPEREYDVEVLVGWGFNYDPKMTTVGSLKSAIRDSLYTDLSQYMNADDFIRSCRNRYDQGGKKAKKSAFPNLDYCDFGSQIRYIDFCPGTDNNCDPEIVGNITTNPQYFNTRYGFLMGFNTTLTNLKYTWKILSETGEEIGGSQPDIAGAYSFDFTKGGDYVIKLIVKNETGCTTTFVKEIEVFDSYCTNEANTFVFESAETNLTYNWTVADFQGNVLYSSGNTNNRYTFTPSFGGYYEIKLSTSGQYNCETVFSKKIYVDNCSAPISCTVTNPLTVKVHQYFIDLINKMVNAPNSIDINVYAKAEIAALAPYISGPDAKIYRFVNNSDSVFFSLAADHYQADVSIPKSASGTISGIDLSEYQTSIVKTRVITNFSGGTNNTFAGFVSNINFCPLADCTPITGVINIVKRGTASTNKKTNSSSKI